ASAATSGRGTYEGLDGARVAPWKRRVHRPVGPDQCDLGALPHPQRHVVEQRSPVRECVAHAVDLEMTHGAILPLPRGPAKRVSPGQRPEAMVAQWSRALAAGSPQPGALAKVKGDSRHPRSTD